METSISVNLSLVSAGDGRWQRKEKMMVRFLIGCMVGITLQGLPLAAAAQIYKWTDAQGKVHYTDRAGDASAGRATEVKVPASPATVAPAGQDTDWRKQEAGFKDRQRDRQRAAAASEWRAPTPPIATGRSGGSSYRQETPQAKCGLGRDILSGAAVPSHRKTDQADRDTAANDVKLFCQ